jgi:clan AA aspartic protease
MRGHVDDEMRALAPVRVGVGGSTAKEEILAWVDTAFNGSLVLPREVALRIGLEVESTAEAVLADGSKVELETYGCAIRWLGKTYDTQVVTNDSAFGLIGTGLLAGRKLTVDYGKKTVTVE